MIGEAMARPVGLPDSWTWEEFGRTVLMGVAPTEPWIAKSPCGQRSVLVYGGGLPNRVTVHESEDEGSERITGRFRPTPGTLAREVAFAAVAVVFLWGSP